MGTDREAGRGLGLWLLSTTAANGGLVGTLTNRLFRKPTTNTPLLERANTYTRKYTPADAAIPYCSILAARLA